MNRLWKILCCSLIVGGVIAVIVACLPVYAQQDLLQPQVSSYGFQTITWDYTADGDSTVDSYRITATTASAVTKYPLQGILYRAIHVPGGDNATAFTSDLVVRESYRNSDGTRYPDSTDIAGGIITVPTATIGDLESVTIWPTYDIPIASEVYLQVDANTRGLRTGRWILHVAPTPTLED
jgi:hypothetical protein